MKQLRPKLHVLIISMYFISMHSEEHYAIRALKAGTSGYFTKGSTTDMLINASRTIFQRGKYISKAVAQLLADNLERYENEPLHDSLSRRELEVMFKVAFGKPVREIADELSLSISSVNNYKTIIIENRTSNPTLGVHFMQ